MSICKRIAPAIGFVFLMCATATFSITRTVAKSGADFSSISAAVKAAQPGDEIVIMDTATYEDPVIIDSTKFPLTLMSSSPMSLRKPTIRYKDTINVGPRTYAEAQDVKNLTFDRNGALQIIRARNVIIDGIAINGGEPFAYGYAKIWNNKDPLQYGNCAVSMRECGSVIIRNCDISNAYIGIGIKDRNIGGIFSNPNPADLDTSQIIPMSRYGLMGNHLIERNRIHNNSVGVFSESSWDLGSVFRYNLVYENHHPTESFETTVKSLTGDGPNHPGGAFLFKDLQLSPFAVYNNTFWRNSLIFAGHWQAGYQHLVFNNIFGTPYKYWQSLSGFSVASMELTPVLGNRMYSNIFSSQLRPPRVDSVVIMQNIPSLLGLSTGVVAPGTLITGSSGFPASAENRWLHMDDSKFLSIEYGSDKFLEPNWPDSNVQMFIAQKGWQASGVKNTDGTWADLGAIEQAHGSPACVGTINPFPSPVTISGTTGQITFALDERLGIMKDPVIKLFRLVKTKYKTNSFGSTDQTLVIGAADMSNITAPSAPPVQVGANHYTVTLSAVADYAFIEMTVEATGRDEKRFTMAGFLPYRNLNYRIAVEIHDKNGSDPVLGEVRVGDTVQLRLLPQKLDGTSFWSPLGKVSVLLSSGFSLMVPGNPPAPLDYPSGLAGGPDSKLVVFTGRPASGIDYIAAGAEWRDPSAGAPVPFVGGTSIKVLPRSAPTGLTTNPPVLLRNGLPQSEVIVKCFDLQGRRIFHKTFFADNFLQFNSRNVRKLSPGLAGKAYVLDICVKDALSLKQMRSVREIVVR